jgi:hypothetical protein
VSETKGQAELLIIRQEQKSKRLHDKALKALHGKCTITMGRGHTNAGKHTIGPAGMIEHGKGREQSQAPVDVLAVGCPKPMRVAVDDSSHFLCDQDMEII